MPFKLVGSSEVVRHFSWENICVHDDADPEDVLVVATGDTIFPNPPKLQALDPNAQLANVFYNI